MFPLNRNRRLRKNISIRSLVQENNLSVNDFIVPVFLVEGNNVKEEIKSMPNYYRYSLDIFKEEAKVLWSLGLKSILLFVKVPDALKDNYGKEALNANGLMQRAIKEIKSTVPEMVIITDVALDPYSIHGHDGVVENNRILNDATVEILTQMALSHAQAGADFVAPSDMMDGRILSIRKELEKNNFNEVGIISYAAKYASNFYGPFRDALDSAPGFGDKKTYQMDFHNKKEALIEAKEDILEGADIIMVKPGMPYLDIIHYLSTEIKQPIAAYQVSGEYAMIKAAIEKGWLDEKVIYESLISFKRAGAKLICSYFAKEIAQKMS